MFKIFGVYIWAFIYAYIRGLGEYKQVQLSFVIRLEQWIELTHSMVSSLLYIFTIYLVKLGFEMIFHSEFSFWIFY